MEFVKVTLKKNGKVIEVLPNEVEGLRNAGVLKEDKQETLTKEEKHSGETKAAAPVTKKNVQGSNPKKGK